MTDSQEEATQLPSERADWPRPRSGPHRDQPPQWPIRNALACIKEVRDRERGDDPRSDTIALCMDYAREVILAINSLREPQPPSPAQEADRAVREFCRGLSQTLGQFGYALEAIAEGEIPDRER